MSENIGDQFVENDDDFGRDVGRGFGAGQEGFDRVQQGRESRPAVGKRAFVIAVHSMWFPACALRPAAGYVSSSENISTLHQYGTTAKTRGDAAGQVGWISTQAETR